MRRARSAGDDVVDEVAGVQPEGTDLGDATGRGSRGRGSSSSSDRNAQRTSSHRAQGGQLQQGSSQTK